MTTMAPNHQSYVMNSLSMEPVSRTYQYRKVMKPLLERKRRARINKCLDELKDLMTGALQAEGENVSKLEKADILELTVRHLHRLKEKNALFLQSDPLKADKYWEGYQQCAGEVSQYLTKFDRNISGELMRHISCYEQKSSHQSHWGQRGPAIRQNSEIIINRYYNRLTPKKNSTHVDLPPSDYDQPGFKENEHGVWRPW